MDVVVGCDPSSRKLAFVVRPVHPDSRSRVYVVKLPGHFIEDRCTQAFEATLPIFKRIRKFYPNADIYFFIEEAVVGRGGARSTIVQSKVAGAVLAAVGVSGATVYRTSVVNSHAKKEVVGKGNADKPMIREWCRTYNRAVFDRYPKDQDVQDAAMHHAYGVRTVLLRKRLERARR